MSVIALAAAQDEVLFRRTLDTFPAAAYTCDSQGLITYFNKQALAVWGRAPKLNDASDRFCGSFRLFSGNDFPVTHDECWMALAIRDRREYLAQEITVERPDCSRVQVLAYATPVLDSAGEVVAAVNILVDISERKKLETILREASRTKDFYRAALADALRNELAPIRDTVDRIDTFVAVCPDMAGSVSQLRAQIEQLGDIVDHMVDVKGKD